MRANQKIIVIACICGTFILSSCKFKYQIIVKDDNTCTLKQSMTFSKAEAQNIIQYLPEIPMNIRGRREYLEYCGIKVISWPNIDPIPDSATYEIEQTFANLESLLYSMNVVKKSEIFSLMNISNYFTEMAIVESNFYYMPKIDDPNHPIYQTNLYDSDVELIIQFNKPLNYTNGSLQADGKTAVWKFKMRDGQYIKIGMINQNKLLDFAIQASCLLIVYNVIILFILKGRTRKHV